MLKPVIVSGSVGSGKTSVATAVGNLLETRSIPHTVVDFDGLTSTFPRPVDDRFGNRLGLANLQAVWRNSAAAGSLNLVVARVVESSADVAAICSAVGAAPATVVRLTAPIEVLLGRLRLRETGAGLDWHLARAVELSRSLDESGPGDLVVATADKTPAEVAATIVNSIEWQV